jgi:hypothetical protein
MGPAFGSKSILASRTIPLANLGETKPGESQAMRNASQAKRKPAEMSRAKRTGRNEPGEGEGEQTLFRNRSWAEPKPSENGAGRNVIICIFVICI